MVFGLVGLFLAVGSICTADGLVVIKNEDNEHIFMVPHQIEPSERGLADYVDFMTRGKVLTHLFFCACGQRASFDSDSWEPIWYGMHEKDYDGNTNTHPWKATAKLFHDKGIDPYKVMVRRTRENGVSPWMSMRMNDVHFVTSDNLSRTTSFWRNHPEYRIYPDEKARGSKRPWSDFTLDFAHPEVRDYNFAMARELLTRYDCDGLELDFLRCVPCLRYEHAIDDAHYLTEFVRRVRRAADRAAEERDHPVGVAVRVPQNLATARKLGLEVEKWATEKLVDIIILSGESAAFFELDYKRIRAVLKAANPDLIVVPSMDRIQCCDESFAIHVNLAGYRGWADSMYARGVEGLYLFNLEYSDMEVQRNVYAGALSPTNVARGHRRYFVTCDDVTTKILKPRTRSFLPVGIDRSVDIPICAGKTLPAERVDVIFGFDCDDVKAESLRPRLNGSEASGFAEEFKTEQYCGKMKWLKTSRRVFRWNFPIEAFSKAVNHVLISPVEDSVAKIIWAEISLDEPVR